MRVVRVLAGMVLLTIAASALLAGALSWFAMQHGGEAGRFRATFEPVAAPGYAVVVPDVEAILHRDAPFTRAGRISVSLTATAGTKPLFLGIAAPGDVSRVLGRAAYQRLDGFSLSRGPLDLHTASVRSSGTPVAKPADKPIWLASGIGSLTFDPSDWGSRPVALVVMARDAEKLDGVALAAAVHFGWLESATWGLLILGPLVLLLGFVVMAWPARQLVYVMAAPRPTATRVTWMDVPTVELPLVSPKPPARPARPARPAAPPPSTRPARPARPQDLGRIRVNVRILGQDPYINPDPARNMGWEWPQREIERPTLAPVDLPTVELPILPRVPLQLHGVGQRVRPGEWASASGPTGGGGPTLTGGTV